MNSDEYKREFIRDWVSCARAIADKLERGDPLTEPDRLNAAAILRNWEGPRMKGKPGTRGLDGLMVALAVIGWQREGKSLTDAYSAAAAAYGVDDDTIKRAYSRHRKDAEKVMQSLTESN